MREGVAVGVCVGGRVGAPAAISDVYAEWWSVPCRYSLWAEADGDGNADVGGVVVDLAAAATCMKMLQQYMRIPMIRIMIVLKISARAYAPVTSDGASTSSS